MIRNSSWKGNIPCEQQQSRKTRFWFCFVVFFSPPKLKTPDAARVTGGAPENQTSYPGGQTARHPIHGAPGEGGGSLWEGGCFLSFALHPLRFSVLNSIKHVERSSFSINRTWLKDGNSYRPPARPPSLAEVEQLSKPCLFHIFWRCR